MNIKIEVLIENPKAKEIIEFFNKPIQPITNYSIKSIFEDVPWFYGSSENECIAEYMNMKDLDKQFEDSIIIQKTVYPDLENDKQYFDVLYDCVSEIDAILSKHSDIFSFFGNLDDCIQTPRHYSFKDFQKLLYKRLLEALEEYKSYPY